jgi:Immunoglobulin I-set domain
MQVPLKTVPDIRYNEKITNYHFFIFKLKFPLQFFFQLSVSKDGQQYFASLEIKNVTVEDAGKYKVTAKNELGESNATITLNFDSK